MNRFVIGLVILINSGFVFCAVDSAFDITNPKFRKARKVVHRYADSLRIAREAKDNAAFYRYMDTTISYLEKMREANR